MVIEATNYLNYYFYFPGGLRKSLIGGGVGLGIAAAYVLFMKSDTFKSYMTRSR